MKYVVMFLFLLTGGCTAPANSINSTGPGISDSKGLLSFFIQLEKSDGPSLQMDIVSIEIASEDGNWVNVTSRSLEVDSAILGNGQKFLGRVALDPGYYTQVRFNLEKVSYAEGDGKLARMPIDSPHIDMILRNRMYIGQGDSQSLFFIWNTKESVTREKFTPVIFPAPKLRNQVRDIALVACPDIDTVFMIRTDRNIVFDSVAIANGVTYLSESFISRDNFYGISERQPMVNLISPTASRVIEQYELPGALKANHMAFDPTGRWGYFIDKQRGNVLLMDMSSGQLVKTERLGYKPTYIIYLKKYNLVAVSLSLSQTVVLLDAETLAQVSSIPTAPRPEGLLNFNDEKWLYIAESGANSVMLYDLDQDTMVNRISVEFSPRRIVNNNFSIYVANSLSNSLSVIKHGQINVSERIALTGRPLELVHNTKNQWIYIGTEDENAVLILDPSTNKVVGQIELGSMPLGIEVL